MIPQTIAPRYRSVSVRGFVAITIALLVTGRATAEDAARLERTAKIDVAITAGTTFLLEQQHLDGTWRSKTYGLLKDGTSLTPLVLWSLPPSRTTDSARAKALSVLSSWINVNSRPAHIRVVPQSPVYSAGLVAKLLVELGKADRTDEAGAWREMLLAYQLTEVNHWSVADLRFGGWGYSHDPPVKPTEAEVLSPLDEPNLSATVFALEGLRAMPPTADRTIELRRAHALRFIHNCQNWSDNAPAVDKQFNDGGFHFVLDDDVRNKAGVAGADSREQKRFISYGSATADGLRGLLLCEVKPDHPRVIAAKQWLIDHFDDGRHPGAYAANRQHLQPSLDFYYAASIAQAFRQSPVDKSDLADGRWAVRLADLLLARQRRDGSWSNPVVDVREDDPLIATSFALRALGCCRDELRGTTALGASGR